MSGPVSDTIKLSEAAAAGASPEGVPKVGDVIAGKYRVERVLGVGGMGVVLAVQHISLGELYAMKFLLPKGANSDAVGRFMREAKAAVRIKSEHIARVNDFGQLENGSPYIVMEHLEGLDLSAFVQRHGAQPVSVAADFIIQACAGLAEAHQLGIVHRDLKPSNLFLTRRSDGTPLIKVLDFGISKAAADSVQPAITSTHESFGSPAYMSPEQIRSAKNVDARSDVFSLGVILFELLTGRLPFQGETSAGLLAAIAADPPTRLSEVLPDANGELEGVVAQALHKRKEDRFPNVSAFATALAPFASAESMSLVQRIARLGSNSSSLLPPSPSLVPPPPQSGGSRPNAKAAAAAATERPWTTNPGDGSGKRSLLFAAIGGAVTAAVLGLIMVTFLRPTKPEPATNARGSAPTSALTATPPPTPSVSESSTAAGTTVAPSVASVASAQEPASSKLDPAASGSRTTNVRPKGNPKPPASTASAAAAPTVSAAPPPKPPALDPTAESH